MGWRISATRVVASTLGAVGGVQGLEHGYFETLQGNVAPSGIVISAIGPPCNANLAWNGCEPAMTIMPSFLAAGLVTIVISLAVVAWAVAFVQRKNSGAVLFALSIMMLLAGGGIIPVLAIILASFAGTRLNKPSATSSWHILSRLWPWSLVAFVLFSALEPALGYFFNDFMRSCLIPCFFLVIILTILPPFAALAQARMDERIGWAGAYTGFKVGKEN